MNRTIIKGRPRILKPALCLDLDGTVRRTISGEPFIKDPKDIELMPGIEKCIWEYKKRGWLIFGVSNQGGVAHGYKTPVENEVELSVTLALFQWNPFDIVKCCYHDAAGKVEPYNHRSLLRKPDIGMLALMEVQAYDNGFIVDWDNSFFVGDRPEDEECAKRAGMTFRNIESFLREPHLSREDLNRPSL